jgi:threonine dehydrogenase-like Zn-dependent dehydrogenase
LTLARLSTPESAFERRYAVGRRSRPDPTITVVDDLDPTSIDARETHVVDLSAAVGPMKLVYEATGHAKHALEAVDALEPNGVAALLGLPGPCTFEFDGGSFHRNLVMRNRALAGSLNASRRHFRAAVETLIERSDWLPEAIVTDVVGLDAVQDALDVGE